MEDTSTIIVIGAGILGLTSALCLQAHFGRTRRILVVARDFPVPSSSAASVNYASMWAGAHYRPMPERTAQDAAEATLARRTYDVFAQQAAREPDAGITFLAGVEYLQAPTDAYLQLRGRYADIDGFRLLQRSELPVGVSWGCEYRSFCVNAPVYCAHLLRKFVLRGGATREYALSALEEAFAIEDGVRLVVNCSGRGFNDPKVFITRGQTCLVANACDRTITQQNADGSWTFLIPRGFNGGTVVGGTKEPHGWSPYPSAETRQRLLDAAAKMYPAVLNAEGRFDVIRDIVGRRPTREGGMRLEVDTSTVPGKTVVHAYGAGGRGYELSWGVAEEVVRLVCGGETGQSTFKAHL